MTNSGEIQQRELSDFLSPIVSYEDVLLHIFLLPIHFSPFVVIDSILRQGVFTGSIFFENHASGKHRLCIPVGTQNRLLGKHSPKTLFAV